MITVVPSSTSLNQPPVIHATNRIIKLGSFFDPLEGVSTVDLKDGDLTDEIHVIENQINPSVEGTYVVTYEVMDHQGAKTTKSILVNDVKLEIPNTGIDQWLLIGAGITLVLGRVLIRFKSKQQYKK